MREGLRYCRGCGRQMIPKQRGNGIDSRTGERECEVVLVCPRFDRSWRNLWLGGWSHYGNTIPAQDGPFVAVEMDISWR